LAERTTEGFDEVYGRAFPVVFKAVFMMCSDRPLAEDATQEAFARALARCHVIGSKPCASGFSRRPQRMGEGYEPERYDRGSSGACPAESVFA
jgi:hypothetical protein